MKAILKSAVAAVALLGMAGAANATTTNQTTYSASSNPILGPILFALGQGSAYNQSSATSNDQDQAGNEKDTFTLTGSVSKDCSFYGGGTTSHTIALGTIGVNTSNTVNVSQAFNMRDAAVANVLTATAGCNTNNTVKIEKLNNTDGLKNSSTAGYDTSEFQNNIPYSVNASWKGVTSQNGGANGSLQSLTVSTGEASDTKAQGAWRSAFNMLVTVPVPQKALVAGTYSDTITVTLAAS
jgi:hypothetical protein